MKAKRFEDKDPDTVSPEDSLGSVKNTMEEKDKRAIPVTKDSELKGVVSYRDIIRNVQFKPDKTQLSKVLHQPPEYDADDSLEKTCSKRIETGKKLLVRKEGEILKAVIGDQEFAEAFTKYEPLSQISTEKIASKDLKTVKQSDSIERARHVMLDENISRIPVLDSNGNLSGILRSTDILRLVSKGERKGGIQSQAGYDGEKISLSDAKVRDFQNRRYQTFNKHTNVKKLVDHSFSKGFHEAIKVEGRNPESIITTKDVVEYISSLQAKNTVLVEISGLEVEEEKKSVHRTIRKRIQGGLGRKTDPSRLKLTIKKADKSGKQHRYSLNMILEEDDNVIRSEVEEYGLIESVSEALDKIESQLDT